MFRPTNPYLLPNSPKLDKLAALYVLLTYVAKSTLENAAIMFHDATKPLPPMFNDVDAVSQYKLAGFRSATQRVLDDEPHKSLNLRNIPGMDRFAACMDLNNLTGQLKDRGSFPNNLFNLVNDWPRVGHNVPRDQHMYEVIEAIFEVFDRYFVAAKVNETRVNDIQNPFCLAGIRSTEMIITPGMEETGGLREELNHFFSRTNRADDETRKRATAIKSEMTFEMPTQGELMVQAAVYRTDDRSLMRYLFDLNPDINIFVIKHRSGNVVIMTRGRQNFSELATVLNGLEPGLWHHETRYRSPFLANGSATRSVEPTKLTVSQLRDLLIENFRYTTRSQDVAVR